MQWLLPAGIEDVLPPRVRLLERGRQTTLQLFDEWGYDQVIPPLAEFEDSLLTGIGEDLAEQTFRMIDPETGGMLGVRADMTPQVARVAARHFDLSQPVRLCYLGSTLQARPPTFHLSRNPLQLGAELFGDSGVAGDVEIVRLMVASLERLGIDGFLLALGHVGVFHALAEEAQLTDEQERGYHDILQRKALAEIDPFLDGLNLTTQQRSSLRALVDLHGGADVLKKADRLLAGSGVEVRKALQELIDISAALQSHLPELDLYFDLAEVRGYHYHTGLVFAAYVEGEGRAIARGGRYDGVTAAFGSECEATGFSADLKNLIALSGASFDLAADLVDQKMVLAPAESDDSLVKAIAALRSEGCRVVNELPGRAAPKGITHLLVELGGEWQLKPLPASS